MGGVAGAWCVVVAADGTYRMWRMCWISAAVRDVGGGVVCWREGGGGGWEVFGGGP
jgi:hypothetical protein